MKPESKAIIFLRHIGCQFEYSGTKDESTTTLDLDAIALMIEDNDFKECKLVLKPLSSISDEDAEIVGKYRYKDPKMMTFTEIGKGIISDYLNRKQKGNFELELFEIDYLRIKGYATDQIVIEDGKVVTYTVEELVKEGVFKF